MSGSRRDIIGMLVEKVENLETRISSIERQLRRDTASEAPVVKQDFKGLNGGIRKLIHEGFFSKPRTFGQICDELKRQMYYYPRTSVNSVITREFMRNQGILTRIGKAGNWEYVLKK